MREFLKKYQKAILLSLIFSIVCFGFMLTHFTITIDEETWLLSGRPSLLWLLQGRFAVWIFNLIFTTEGNFAPFLWDFLSILMWHLSGVMFAYGLLNKEKVKEWKLFLFLSYYSSLPFVVGEIMSFSMFNLQVCVAMAAAAAGFLFTLRFMESKGKKDAALTFLFLVYAFATYQALICVYATAVVAYALFSFLRKEDKSLLRFIITSVIFCAAATVVYYGIDLLIWEFSGTAGYLEENYIGWFSGNPFLAAGLAVANVARVSFAIPFQGVSIYGGGTIRGLSVLFVIYALCLFFRTKGWKQKSGVFFYTFSLCAAPFVLYLAIATYKTHGRMLLAIPLVGAVQMYLILNALKKIWLKRAMLVFCGYILFMNARNMNLIYFYGSIAYERDCTTADQVMYDIKKAGMDYHQKPIAFIGYIPQDDVGIQTSDTLGGSIFAWDEGNISRMRDFLRTKGYAVTMPTDEGIAKAYKESVHMQNWPMEGSIQELEDMIIVKLSEPTEKWFQVNNVKTK